MPLIFLVYVCLYFYIHGEMYARALLTKTVIQILAVYLKVVFEIIRYKKLFAVCIHMPLVGIGSQ